MGRTRRTAAAAVAGLTLAGLIGVGVAGAATGTGPGGRIADALAGLVSNGTLTQDQADAVSKALDDARAKAWADRDARMTERRAEVDALVKDTLGMTTEELRQQIAAGKTLREVAGDNAEALAAGFVAMVKEDLDAEVAEGDLTQAQADERLAAVQKQVDAWLAGDDTALRGRGLGLLWGLGGHGPGMGGPGMGGPGMMGHRGGGWDADDVPESTTPDSNDSGTSESGASTAIWQA